MKDLVGPYRIQSLLGHGGMGIVYLGVHDHLDREVAIKALAPELTRHPEFRERFFAEARVQARLQHSNIVTIYDLIEDEGNFFIVMEHVPGPTLETLLKEGGGKEWALDHSLSLFRQILAGLDYAHSKGVIHRDVKSSNVLITDGDLVKLTDFGIALLIGNKRLTASHSTIGTPTYMSPEQILRPRTVDHRSDVYSAAIVLYEMLAGQPPFDAETEYEIKKLQIEAPVPDVRELRPEVPSETANALSMALKKDPEERFQSAGAFLRALRQDAVAAPVSSAPPVIAVAPKDAVRAPWKLPAAAAAGVLVVAIPLLAFALRERPATPEAPAQTEPLEELRTEKRAESINTAPPPEAASVPLAASVPPTPLLEAPVRKNEPPGLGAIETSAQDRDGVRKNIERPQASVEERPRGQDEKDSSTMLEESLDAEPQQERLDTPGVPESIAERSRALIEQSRTLDPANRRVARKLTITGVEIHPQVVSPGGRAVAVAYATISPALQQATPISVLVRVVRSLDEITVPIGHEETLPAGGGPWRITIPINIPRGTATGDCFVEVNLWDSERQLKGTRRIGFTIR